MDALLFLQFLLAGKKRRYRNEMRMAQAIAILQSGSEESTDTFYQLFDELPPDIYKSLFGRHNLNEFNDI